MRNTLCASGAQVGFGIAIVIETKFSVKISSWLRQLLYKFDKSLVDTDPDPDSDTD